MLDAIRAGARGYVLKPATFQPDGLPADEAVALTANCLALKQSPPAAQPSHRRMTC